MRWEQTLQKEWYRRELIYSFCLFERKRQRLFFYTRKTFLP